MFMRHHTLSLALAVAGLMAASAAVAGPTPSTNQIFTAENLTPSFTPSPNSYVIYGDAITNKLAGFRNSLVDGVKPFTFENPALLPNTGAPIELAIPSSVAGDPIIATLTGAVVRAETLLGRYNTTTPTAETPSPRKYLEVQTAATAAASAPSSSVLTPTEPFTIKFSKAISAFAFFGTDIGDFDGTLYMEMYLNDALQTTLTVRDGTAPAMNGNELLFYGFASPEVAYDKIVFRTKSPGGNDVFGFDDFWAADAGQLVAPSPTPEPGSLALVGLALAAAGLMRRRKV
jgi:hypothetical protein